MEFLDFVQKVVGVLTVLAQQWPALVVTVALVPAVTNLLKWAAAKLGLSLDGYSEGIAFGLNALLFALYAVMVWKGLPLSGAEQIAGAVATLIAAFLGLVGGLGSKLAYVAVWKKVPGPLGFSYSK